MSYRIAFLAVSIALSSPNALADITVVKAGGTKSDLIKGDELPGSITFDSTDDSGWDNYINFKVNGVTVGRINTRLGMGDLDKMIKQFEASVDLAALDNKRVHIDTSSWVLKQGSLKDIVSTSTLDMIDKSKSEVAELKKENAELRAQVAAANGALLELNLEISNRQPAATTDSQRKTVAEEAREAQVVEATTGVKKAGQE